MGLSFEIFELFEISSEVEDFSVLKMLTISKSTTKKLKKITDFL